MTSCAWCGTVIDRSDASVASHGICQECEATFLEGAGSVPAGELVEGFEFPLLLVNWNVELVEANNELRNWVKKELAAIKGRLGGDVLGCIHSSEPGGCGRTADCARCQIRNSVTRTYFTGEPLTDVDSHQEMMTECGPRTIHLKISTAKFLNSVLLKIVAQTGPGETGLREAAIRRSSGLPNAC
jgi:hypothetical protein